MKKIASILIILVLMVFVLTGCGSSKDVNATMEQGGMEVSLNVKFKGKVANEVKMVLNCEDEETAESFAEFYSSMIEGEEEKVKVKQDGKKVTITAKSSSSTFEYDEKATRDEIIESLKEEGWQIK